MIPVKSKFCFSVAAIALLGFVGCKKTAEGPKPLAITEAPKTITDTFTNASGPSKEMASDSSAAMSSGNYPQALETLQLLSGRTDLTPEQRQAAARSLQTVNQELAKKASEGDKQAEDALKKYRSSK